MFYFSKIGVSGLSACFYIPDLLSHFCGTPPAADSSKIIIQSYVWSLFVRRRFSLGGAIVNKKNLWVQRDTKLAANLNTFLIWPNTSFTCGPFYRRPLCRSISIRLTSCYKLSSLPPQDTISKHRYISSYPTLGALYPHSWLENCVSASSVVLSQFMNFASAFTWIKRMATGKLPRRSPSPLAFGERAAKRRKIDHPPLTPDDYRNGVMLAPMVRSGARTSCTICSRG